MDLENTFLEIEKAIEYGLYTLAFSTILAIPDICGALESGDGRANGNKYKKWYNTYVKNVCRLNGEEVYYLRCSMLHQGRTSHIKSEYSRILFFPSSNGLVFHDNSSQNETEYVLTIDLKIFCEGVIAAGRKWLDLNKNNPIYLKNIEDSYRFHSNGLSPHFLGIPLFG